MKILVCGGRHYSNIEVVTRELNHEFSMLMCQDCLVIQGGAYGADALAKQWAENAGVHCAEVRALWTREGKAAGPIRNSVMLRLLQPDLVLAFPGGAGTANCVRLARALGIRVREIADDQFSADEEWNAD